MTIQPDFDKGKLTASCRDAEGEFDAVKISPCLVSLIRSLDLNGEKEAQVVVYIMQTALGTIASEGVRTKDELSI